MYKIAAIGDRESVIGFSALGVETFETDSAKAAETLVSQLEKSDFAVILVTEKLYCAMRETAELYRSKALPVIIPIPGASGNSGIGKSQLRSIMEKAVGSDTSMLMMGGKNE